ncbi:MAG: quinol:electron acceptor oxidoreductase subunit ActD [Candidatus Aquicultorales bacterium]
MAANTVMGVFGYVDDTAKAVEALFGAGFENFEVYSPVPSHEIEDLMGGRKKELHVSRVTLAGLILTGAAVLAFSVWTSFDYPLQQSGMPILPLPPIILSVAVLAVLGGIIGTFAGFVGIAGLPAKKPPAYHPGVSDDKFAIVVSDDSAPNITKGASILKQHGAEQVEIGKPATTEKAPRKEWSRMKVAAVLGATGLSVLVAVLAYGPFWVWYNNTGLREMWEVKPKPQKTIDPRYPASSVAMGTGRLGYSARIDSEARANPIKPTTESIKKGQKVYLTHCAVCHGKTGEGQGIMGSVPNLSTFSKLDGEEAEDYIRSFIKEGTSIDFNYIGGQKDGVIYDTITNGGWTIMPAFKDAIEPEERWHLINFIKRGFIDASG